MSSVCGIINSFLSEKNIPLLKMMAQIDNCAIYADEAKWLLASDSSKQLFVNKNSGVTVAFCGAIYNLDILKQELDCEVQNDADILSHLYCRYGVDFVNHTFSPNKNTLSLSLSLTHTVCIFSCSFINL